MQVSVRDNNVDQALRALKKKLQREVYSKMLPSPFLILNTLSGVLPNPA